MADDLQNNLIIDNFYYFYPFNIAPLINTPGYDFIIKPVFNILPDEQLDLPVETILNIYKLTEEYYGFIYNVTTNKVLYVQLRTAFRRGYNLGPLQRLEPGVQFVEKKEKIRDSGNFITQFYGFYQEKFYRGKEPTKYCLLDTDVGPVTEENCEAIPRCFGLIPRKCLISNVAQFEPFVRSILKTDNSDFLLYPAQSDALPYNECVNKNDGSKDPSNYKLYDDGTVGSNVECEEKCIFENDFICKGFEWQDNDFRCEIWNNFPIPNPVVAPESECFIRNFYEPYIEKVTTHRIHKRFRENPGAWITVLVFFTLIAIFFRRFKNNDPFDYFKNKFIRGYSQAAQTD